MPDTRSLLSHTTLTTQNGRTVEKPQTVSAKRNIHPIIARALSRTTKERHLGQRARVIWLFGLSGSGKSTLALALERRLHASHFATALLDGDNLRTSLNRDLGFTDADRAENIRRTAETARLFVQSGIIAIASLITPRTAHRELARSIIGDEDFLPIYVKASFETCALRDPKGLYRKSAKGRIPRFTGTPASPFEPPFGNEAALVIDTETTTPDEALARLHAAVLPHIRA